MTNFIRTTALDRPTPSAIALKIASAFAGRVDFEGDFGNFERHCLQEVVALLSADPPKLSEALTAAESGVAHAWRGMFVETRDEAWICAAVADLLRDR